MSDCGPTGLAARLLGREVLRGADDRADLGHVGRVRGAGDAEVGHLEDAVGADQHVVRLDVAVDDAAPVRVLEPGQRLLGVADRLALGQRRVGVDLVLQRLAVDVLHRDVVLAAGLAAVVDGDDVGVRQAGRRPGLPAEALDEPLVARVPLGQDLDGDPAVERLVGGEVDVGHPARSDPSLKAVPAVEQLSDAVVGGHGATYFATLDER